MTAPDFLTVQDVRDLHARLLEEHGGQEGIRDVGLLESAVAMPAATYDGVFLHEDLATMAAAYVFHIAENQPFIDGNKRAAMVAGLVFLEINDVDIEEANELFYKAMIDVSARRLSKSGLAGVFRGIIDASQASA